MLLRILVSFIFTSFFVKSNKISCSFVRIYSNQAEIIQPLSKLPLEFTDEVWSDIRSDSITLLGENVNITSQTITEKPRSLNGAEVYVRSPMSFDKTMINFVKGIIIDENTNLVKIDDKSIADQQNFYFTVKSDEILYLEQPSKPKFYVNFTYDTTDTQVSVSYLRANLKWHTQYQLNLNNDDSVLIAMANIRNDGKSSLSINQAELIGGDINLHVHGAFQHGYTSAARSITPMRIRDYDADESIPIVEQGNQLAGLYIFPINKPFVIDAQTNYLLPMFRPHITVERYGLISKFFSKTSNSGKAQRSYRLTSDQFLSRGNCLIRELDRIVGETFFPDLSASGKYKFSIGDDADIVYKENVILISSTTFTEEVHTKNDQFNTISEQVIHTRTRSVYEINVQIKNFKSHSISIEYEQKEFYGYQSVKLMTSDNQQFYQDGSSIKANMTLNANDEQTYSYGVELVH